MEYNLICPFTPDECPNQWLHPLTGDLQHRCFVVNREKDTLLICHHAVIDVTGWTAGQERHQELESARQRQESLPQVHARAGLKAPNKFYLALSSSSKFLTNSPIFTPR